MISEPLAPLCDDDGEASACPECRGSGLVSGPHLCRACNGSGYGPAIYAVSRERQHCLERLARWAHREPLPEEN